MSAGGSTGVGDTRFSRKGTAETSSFRDLTPKHQGLFTDALDASKPGSANASVNGMLNNRINADVGERPYRSDICQIIKSNLPNQKSPAENVLNRQATQDVYSNRYENNTFNRYAEEVQKAMGMARSGPGMTRGGTAAQGFAQAQVVNDLGMNREQALVQNRGTDAQIGQGAAGLLQQNRHSMNSDAIGAIGQGQQGYSAFLQNMMSAAGLASERGKMFNDLVPTYTTLDSVMKGKERNDLSGRGAQTSSSMGGGFNLCCFIFMEAYNGEMPEHVRACRDEFAPESSARRKGYILMSRWLVPAMRVSGFSRSLTNHLLIRPLTRWGAWYKNVPGSKFQYRDALAKRFWFGVWELIGKTK
jgi:hypothetical protein